jgi:hypothetical protein
MYCIRGIKANASPILIIVFSLLLAIPSSVILIANNFLDTTTVAYGKTCWRIQQA